MIAVDSSVVVAAFATWHEHHEAAIRTMGTEPMIADHALLEGYAVLTRLPSPHRAPTGIVVTYLELVFPSDRVLTPPHGVITTLPRRCYEAGLGGGATYDALIGLTCADAGAELVTLDLRSLRNLQALGVPARLAA